MTFYVNAKHLQSVNNLRVAILNLSADSIVIKRFNNTAIEVERDDRLMPISSNEKHEWYFDGDIRIFWAMEE